MAGAALLVLFVSLGNWQLDRAEEKRIVMADLAAAAEADPVPLDLSAPEVESLRFRRVVLIGVFDPRQQFLLDNQLRQGQPGYQVLTPFRLRDSDRIVLIDRGWLARGPDRGQLPEVVDGLTTDTVTIRGQVHVPYGEGFRLGEMDTESDRWPRVIQYLDFEAIADRLGDSVAPLTIRLDEAAPLGYERNWHPVLPMGPERHIGYAVQWFGLALALVIIVLIVGYRRRRHGSAR